MALHSLVRALHADWRPALLGVACGALLVLVPGGYFLLRDPWRWVR